MTWTRNRPIGLVYHDKKKSFGGYTLYSPVRGHHADLLDAEGRIVHQWQHPEGLQHIKLLPNGNLLVHALPPEDAEGAEHIGGCAAALLELDRNSKVVWEYRDPYMHHDYQRLPNGNTLVVRWDKMPADSAARVQGGYIADDDPEWMWGDVVREIDPEGNTVDEWRTWEHLNPDHHVKCPLESRKEWLHLNSIEFTKDGDWLLSFRLSSTVVIVNARTGRPRWRWGAGVLSHQHHATWLRNGHILLFDNGCHRREMPSFSQVVEVDPKTKKVVWSYQSEMILGLFSFMISGCQRLPNGNTFIAEGASGHLFEVTKSGETVWEYVSPWALSHPRFGVTTAVFRAYRIADDDPRLEGLPLAPAKYARFNTRISAGKTLSRDVEPGVKRAAKKAPAKKAPAKKGTARKRS